MLGADRDGGPALAASRHDLSDAARLSARGMASSGRAAKHQVVVASVGSRRLLRRTHGWPPGAGLSGLVMPVGPGSGRVSDSHRP